MSGGQSKRLLSSETEYYGYMDYSEEQYSDYYRGNIIEYSQENHEEMGLCVNNKETLKIFSMFPVNSNEISEYHLALCLPITIVFLFLR